MVAASIVAIVLKKMSFVFCILQGSKQGTKQRLDEPCIKCYDKELVKVYVHTIISLQRA